VRKGLDHECARIGPDGAKPRRRRFRRQGLVARRALLEPLLGRHGIRLKLDVLSNSERSIHAALIDTRPLKACKPGVRQCARDLSHTLDQLEAWLVAAR